MKPLYFYNEGHIIAGEFLTRGLLLFTNMSTKYLPVVIKPTQWPSWHRHNYPLSQSPRVPGTMLTCLCLLIGVACAAALTLSTSLLYHHKYAQQHGGNSPRCSTNTLKRVLIYENLRLFFALSLSLFLTDITTDVVKALVGRPRPDFLARCQPPGFDPNFPNFELLPQIPVCHAKGAVLWEARRSMPSGHSSSSFCFSTFMALFLFHQVFVGRARRLTGLRIALAAFAMAPAVYISLSRIIDFRHHWEDVLVGSLIGTGFSIMCYQVYYPASEIIVLAFDQVKEKWSGEISESDPLRHEL